MAQRISVLADYGARGAVGSQRTPPETDPTIPKPIEFLHTNQPQMVTSQTNKLPKSLKETAEVKEPKELGEEYPSRRVKIHTRTLIQWRAKIPPPSGESDSCLKSRLSSTSPNSHSKEYVDLEKGSARHERENPRPEPSRTSSSATSASLSLVPQPVTKEICLHWKVEKNESEESIGLNYNTTRTKETPKSHLTWQ
jgi:hypothetical protein